MRRGARPRRPWRRSDAPPLAALRRAALDRRLHLYPHGSLLLVAPPLVVGREEVATGLSLLHEVLAVADELARA
jgi:adenosylmethionine-8-amino-7-oxononanoate aminotransferase